MISRIPPPRAGEVVGCRYIDPDNVPTGLRHWALLHCSRLAAQLGIDEAGIAWFEPVTVWPAAMRALTVRLDVFDFFDVCQVDGELPAGVTWHRDPWFISINAGLRGAALTGVVAHEMRHVWQLRQEAEADEADAERFAAHYLEDLAA